ncbi:hypothetical protein MMC24_006467 [Lignoscripta atroalba]|nr:hypothetical protein [Lignoscripta atroalba]
MSANDNHASHHPIRRLKQFLRPDGRRVHVVATPEDAETLKHQLSRDPHAGEFELIMHGSPEHVNVIREFHAHNEEKRDALREKHTSIYQEFAAVHAELDALSAELRMLTEHGVALDANFSRYGYSAHIRTREADSSTNSLHSTSHEKRDWEAERHHGRAMRFWKKPVIRQYFHKGLIWRASEKEEVASFELFVDLLYVGIIAINGDRAAEHPTGEALLQFCITFILSWKLWSDLTLVISWFETDDIVQRLGVLFIMACLTGYTTNIMHAFDSTYTPLIAFYLTSRFFQATFYLWVAYLLPLIRGTMIASTVVVAIPSALWIASIHTEGSTRLALIWLAIPCDLFGTGIVFFTIRAMQRFENGLLARIGRTLEFYPAVNIEHKSRKHLTYRTGDLANVPVAERINAFVTLVFGSSVLALLVSTTSDDINDVADTRNLLEQYQNQAVYGINA